MAGQNMFTFVLLATALFALPNVAFGTEYIVGDDRGWKLDVDYAAWAKGKTFHVGDTLVFKYTPAMHNVFSVDEDGYKNCIIPKTGALTSGNDKVKLDSPGPKYYVCGVGPHCEKGNQKVEINVEPAAGGEGATTTGATNSSTNASTTSNGTLPSPAPSQAPSSTDSSTSTTGSSTSTDSSTSNTGSSPSTDSSTSTGSPNEAPTPSTGTRSAEFGVLLMVAMSMMALVF